MDEKVLNVLNEINPDREKAALATIIRTLGSTPRGEGAQMLVFADGRTVGTIGGGCGEAEVKRAALIAIDEGNPRVFRVDLNSDLAADEGMVCGGNMEVFLEPIRDQSVFPFLADSWKKEKPIIVSTVISSKNQELVAKKTVLDLQGRTNDSEWPDLTAKLEDGVYRGKPRLIKTGWPGETEEVQVFIQPMLPQPKLLILGAGHVAYFVANLAKDLDFKITVIDDRPDFANRVRFPQADQVICDDFQRGLAKFTIGPSTYVVIVTRGHRSDEDCLKVVVDSRTAYIGLIGSRRRIKLLFNKLMEEGISKEVLEKIYTPIGLDIGAETPAEIAISILAEIIQVKHHYKAAAKRRPFEN